MKLNQNLLTRLTLLLTLFLLALISVITYQKIVNLIAFDKKVIHTHEVLYKLERVISTLKDAESGQRGFLLSGDSIFLEPYNNSRKTTDSLINNLLNLTSDNLVQSHKIDSLKNLISKSYEFMNFANHLEATQLINKEILVSTLKNGKITNDKIRGVIDRIQKEEESLLYLRNREKDKLVIITPLITMLLSFFSLFMILNSYFTLIRELKMKTKIQDELENKIDELNRSNSDLEQFAYVASHDLQEPLRKIRSFGDRLVFKQSDKLDEDGKLNIQRMQDAAMRMQKLIDDLLGFSRLVRSENKFETTNLNELVNSVLNDFDETIKLKNAKIEINRLPIINAVPSQMRQLFQNLISNALKFSKSDITPQIKIQYSIVKGSEIKDSKPSSVNDLFHRIIVTDNGIGFDEQYLDRIFVIFQRLHGKMEYGGTGIGLAVSKKIVTNHNGYITATSRPGAGASFYVYLPNGSRQSG